MTEAQRATIAAKLSKYKLKDKIATEIDGQLTILRVLSVFDGTSIGFQIVGAAELIWVIPEDIHSGRVVIIKNQE